MDKLNSGWPEPHVLDRSFIVCPQKWFHLPNHKYNRNCDVFSKTFLSLYGDLAVGNLWQFLKKL